MKIVRWIWLLGTALLIAEAASADDIVQANWTVAGIEITGFTPAELSVDLAAGKNRLLRANAIGSSASGNFVLYVGTGYVLPNGNVQLMLTAGYHRLSIAVSPPEFNGTVRAIDPGQTIIDEGTLTFTGLTD